MSVRVMSAVWMLKMPPGEQMVLLALADHAHDDGTRCYPGVRYLSWKTGYSERQVQRILRNLEKSFLIRAEGEKVGGRGHATDYTIITANGVLKPPYIPATKGDTLTPIPATKGDICDMERVTSETRKGDIAMSPQPSLTVIKEPSFNTTPPFGRRGVHARARDDNHGGGNLLAAVWTRETGATLNPAQWRKLQGYERLAAEKGLPELVAATIRECAEKGKPWEWFTTVIQGRLDGTAKPTFSARPSPNGHTTLKQQAEARQRQKAAEEDTYDLSKPEDEARAICHDEFMNPDSRRMMKLPPWTCECGQHDERGRRLQAVSR